MAVYTPEILVFDLAPPLQYAGAEAYRENLEDWFRSFDGPIGYEIRDLEITAGEGAAFSHSLNRISGSRTNGEQTDVWVRATAGYRKVEGKWRVAHEHFSTPFEMTPPFKASLDLKP
jgi:ketosteroid isomerase-like protein